MGSSNRDQILELLHAAEKIDIHTHLTTNRLMARGLDDIMLYHMLNTELYAAGAPIGARVNENRDEREAIARVEAAIPYLDRVRNTAIFWIFKRILSDLYDWHNDVTLENWRRLDDRIKEYNSDDEGRARSVLQQLYIQRSEPSRCVEVLMYWMTRFSTLWSGRFSLERNGDSRTSHSSSSNVLGPPLRPRSRCR